MPRPAKLHKHNGQWRTLAGNRDGAYFGRVDEVSHADAQKAFRKYLNGLSSAEKTKAEIGAGPSVNDLIDAFLSWLKVQRSDRTAEERAHHLQLFANFFVRGGWVGHFPATSIKASDMTAFLDNVATHKLDDQGKWVKRKSPLDPFTVGKHFTSISACFVWGAGKKNPNPLLPIGFAPFAAMERYKRPADPLLESELPTKEEIEALLRHADDDLGLVDEPGRYRKRTPEEFRKGAANPYAGFADMLRVYRATGARTGELCAAQVAHFVRSAKQIVLAKHKRMKTMKASTSRRMLLNDEAFKVVDRLCMGRPPSDYIFLDPKGRPWDQRRLNWRFATVRKHTQAVRREITIYSFRHLWISEALMAGVDVGTVAKMAGTSIAMVEKVYGHYTSDHFAEAQAKLDARRRG